RPRPSPLFPYTTLFRSARAQLDEVDGRAVITLFTGPPDSFGLLGKRLLDLSLSLVACLLLLPLFLVVAIAIKLDSRGPILFAQEDRKSTRLNSSHLVTS